MTPYSSARPADPRAGRYIPWIFVGGFLTVIAVNAVMVAVAIGSFSGVETPKHYAEGLAYNQVLRASRAQAALGWSIDLRAVPLANDNNGDVRTVELRVTARDAAGGTLDNLALRGLAIRPTSSGQDQAVDFTWTGQGVYEAAVHLPLPGQWDLRLIANRGAEHWQSVRRLQVP